MQNLVPVFIGLTVLGVTLTALPTLVVEWARRNSPEVLFYARTEEPVVALSIDDGPSPATPEILDVLDQHRVRATFFVIGDHVREHPDLAARLVEDGHELGHHMMRDEPSIHLPPETFRARFREMDALLAELGGSRLFRPASGWYDERMVEEAAQLGYRTVLGSVYPFDAQLPFPDLASWYVRQHATAGAVLVLHDGSERGPRTAEVLRNTLPALKQRGYRIVPISTLLERGRAASTEPPEAPTASALSGLSPRRGRPGR